MLYNPKWKDRESFVKWLGEQPPEEAYTYSDPRNCAVAQYKRAQGLNYAASNPQSERKLGWFEIVATSPHTFGAAYKRARGGWMRRFLDGLRYGRELHRRYQ